MRQELVDEAVREFIAAQDTTTIYQTAVTRIAQFLNCDFCYIVEITDHTPIPQASSDDEFKYETTATSFVREVAKAASARNTVSVINDITFTRDGTAQQSTTTTGSNREPEPEEARSPATADDMKATESDVMQQSVGDPRSLLTVPFDDCGVVQAMDGTVGAFTDTDVEWVEHLLSFACPALVRLQTSTPSHRNAELNGVPPTNTGTSSESTPDLEITLDQQSTSSGGGTSGFTESISETIDRKSVV